MSTVLPSDIFTFDDTDDATTSPSTLFPQQLSYPTLDELQHNPTGAGAVPNNGGNGGNLNNSHNNSIGKGLNSNSTRQYVSPNSLSPHSSDPSHPSLSPPTTSDSPTSSLSFTTDEYLLSSNFGPDELDLLIFPEDTTLQQDLNALSLPFQHPTSSVMNMNPSFDLPLEAKSQLDNGPSTVSGVPMGAIQPPAPFDGVLHQWRMDLRQNPAAQWIMQQQPLAQVNPPPHMMAHLAPTHQHFQPHVKVEMMPPHAQQPQQQQTTSQHQPVNQSQGPVQEQKQQQTLPAEAPSSLPLPPPRRSAPNAPINRPAATTPPVNVGKHNKTERRYRQKVQQAQADLRDAVPALRVLYGTSSEEQKQTTDIRAADGTVDGLGEVTRPNASAKATILIGARMYIELLQRRTAMLQRKVGELEQYRERFGGRAELDAWRHDFDNRETIIAAEEAAATRRMSSFKDSDVEESEEEEDESPSRKRARPSKKAKVNETKVTAGMRAFAAFAVSFSLMPSASKLFKSQTSAPVGGTVYTGELSHAQVISRLPLIIAEHGSRLLARALPAALVPAPHTIVDWTMRLFVTLCLIIVLGPILERATKQYQDKGTGAGSLAGISRDLLHLYIGSPTEDMADWTNLAARIVGGVASASSLVRWHVAVRLRRASEDPYSLALLALLEPSKPTSRHVWAQARAKCQKNSPLRAVLALPLDEAARCLELVPPTAAPIAAIVEQINLVHLYDLYSRFFVHLVNSAGNASSLPAMLVNLQTNGMAGELKTLDREIRGVLQDVPRNSAASGLSLVLLGLWGLFSGYQQAVPLVSALAEEEVSAAGLSLDSVSAMLELLYPGSSTPRSSRSGSLSPNAQAIDKLAIACIGFVDLLFSSSRYNLTNKGIARLEANQRVQKEAARLRLVLTQANFVGLDDEEGDSAVHAFEKSRQKLVSILSTIGRRAAGRSAVTDEDSGVDDDGDVW